MFFSFLMAVQVAAPGASPVPPVNPTGAAEIAVRKDGQGRVIECRIIQSSGDPLIDRDTCRAAVRAKPQSKQ